VTKALLSVDGMTCAYGSIIAVRDLSFSVGEGEIVALLGPNGAGKSTALRALSGMRRAHKGNVVFAGKRVERWPSDRIARLGMSLVPEGRRLFTELTVEENLRMGGFAVAQGELDGRIAEMCSVFPILASRRGQRAGTLSGGEQQQLAIARAMVAKPRLLIIDEMSLGLSPLVVTDLYRTVRAINMTGTSVLLVEQQVNLALTVADRIYLIERGQVKDEGPASKFRDVASVAGAYMGTEDLEAPAAAPANGIKPSIELVKLPLRPGQARALQRVAKSRGSDVGAVVVSAIEVYLESLPKDAVGKPAGAAAEGAVRASRAALVLKGIAAKPGEPVAPATPEKAAKPAPARSRSSAPPSPPSPKRAPRSRPG
jgi:branched-chain amino acid transport system ATP-binding protein